MRISRRQFTTSLCAASLLGTSGLSLAQSRTIKVLVGYAPGGAADAVARAVGEGMRDAGYTVVVENRAGAAGRLASEALLSLPADGSTLLLAPLGNLTLHPHIFKSLRFDPLRDLAGVGTANEMSFAIAVGANSPARTLQEFLALARRDKNFAAYGTPGPGTAMHFLGQMLAREAKVQLTHVPYKGGSVAVTDAIGGTLPALITTTPNLLSHHRSGKLRILAISDAAPLPALPGVPTFKSLGFTALGVTEHFGFFARAGTPQAVISQLNQAITAAVKSPKVNAVLEQAEYHPRTMTPDALDRLVRAEHASWARVVKDTGYTPED